MLSVIIVAAVDVAAGVLLVVNYMYIYSGTYGENIVRFEQT